MSGLADEVRFALNGTKSYLREINGRYLLNVRIDGWWTEFEEISKRSVLAGKDWNYYNDDIATKQIWDERGLALRINGVWHIFRDYYVHNHRNDDIPEDLRWQAA